MNNKKIIYIVSGVTIILAMSIGAFFVLKNNTKVDKQIKDELIEKTEKYSSTNSTKQDETCEVKKTNDNSEDSIKSIEKKQEYYRNYEIGFSIKYSTDLSVEENDSSVSFIRDCSGATKESFIEGHKCQVEGDFKISLYPGTLDDFINDYEDDCREGTCYTKIFLQEDFILDDIKATRLEGNSMEGSGIYNYIFASNAEKNYIISYNYNVEEYQTMIESFEFTNEEITSGKIKAFTKNEDGYNYVIVENNGEKIIVEEAPNDPTSNLTDALSFLALEFSPDGKYLKYKAYGWEWSLGRVYDIEKNEIILKIGSPYNFEFINNGEYLYACASNALAGEYYAKLYKIPSFELIENVKIDHEAFPISVECEYDENNNEFIVSQSYDATEEMFEIERINLK